MAKLPNTACSPNPVFIIGLLSWIKSSGTLTLVGGRLYLTLCREWVAIGLSNLVSPLFLMTKFIAFLGVLILSVSFVCADDWASWLGPTRDSVYHESGVVTSIPESGLKVSWEASVEMGYSGPSVADGKVFLMDYIHADGEITNRASWNDELQGQERVLYFDKATGEQLWVYSYDRP